MYIYKRIIFQVNSTDKNKNCYVFALKSEESFKTKEEKKNQKVNNLI
jgi:hypothetical protein